MTQSYDVVIIGSGPGGYVAAKRASSLGLKTALVEKSELGGTCLHRGCIPTKALLHAADTYEEIKHGARIGIKTLGVEIDWSEIQRYKDQIVNSNANGVAHLMKKVDIYEGYGSLKNNTTVQVVNDKKTTILSAANIILAVGSTPKHLAAADHKSSLVLTSDSILGLKSIPGTLTIIGGGVIGIEFASIFARFGCKVKVIEALPRVLAGCDLDCAKELVSQLEKQGVSFHTNVRIEAVKEVLGQSHVIFNEADGKTIQHISDYTLVSIGRAPLTDNLGLEHTKVKLDQKGFIIVDGQMKTHEPNIYAIGDCINTPWLAHVASKEGLIAIDNIAHKNPTPFNYDHTPYCVYSYPPIAWCGFSEDQAKAKGYDVKVGKFDLQRNAKAAILQKNRGFIKFVIDKKYGEILGVHIVGPDATELLAEPAFAMQMEATIDDIADTMHAHPTLYEAIYEAALVSLDRPLHG